MLTVPRLGCGVIWAQVRSAVASSTSSTSNGNVNGVSSSVVCESSVAVGGSLIGLTEMMLAVAVSLAPWASVTR